MTIDKYQDIIDSRDVIERLEELAAIRANAEEFDEEDPLSDEEIAEETALLYLAEQGEDSSEDWPYGATLVRDSYFVEYAQELAEDIGALPREHTWPQYCIDWEWAARELQMDYTPVEFDGVTYWVR